MRSIHWLWLAALWFATLFAVGMALWPHPPAMDVGDKYQHMTAFATLTVLAVIAYPRARLLRIGERLSFLGAMIELAQSIPALHRDCDIHDWLADTAAIVVVLLVVRVWRDRRITVGAP